MTETGSSNTTVRGIALFLTEDEVKDMHYALWLAYGNDDGIHALWAKLRQTCGEDMWARVVADSGRPR